MARLSVNINKIATLRNSRGGDNPNLVQVAKDCERFGAQGITVHQGPMKGTFAMLMFSI
jgi:pyridoxine 5-phosphate synthase